MVPEDELDRGTIGGLDPPVELREQLLDLLESMPPVRQVEGVDKIRLEGPVVVGVHCVVLHDGLNSVNHCFTPTLHTNPELEGGQKPCSPLSQGKGEAFLGKTTQDVTYGDGSEPA